MSLPEPLRPAQWPDGHVDEQTFAAYLAELPVSKVWRQKQAARRRAFVARWPRLEDWLAEPLPVRVGSLPGQRADRLTDRISFEGRLYVIHLSLQHGLRLDWPYLTAAATLRVPRNVGGSLAAGIECLVADSVQLGYTRRSSEHAFWPLVGRLLLAAGHADPARLGEADLTAYAQALTEFAKREDVAAFYGPAEAFTVRAGILRSHLHRLATVLYHRGQLAEPPSMAKPTYAQRHVGPPAMEKILVRYLETRALDARPSTLEKVELGLRRFMAFLAQHAPQVTDWEHVTRQDALAFATYLDTATGFRSGHPLRAGQPGNPLAIMTKRAMLSAVSVFTSDVASWGWPGGPTRPLLGAGDLPKMPRRVPRYIPDHELDRLMAAVTSLPDSYQRAALLIARWSGARRDEIRRLELDCLDAYPDGTPRLRIPAGKTRRERQVPIHPDAADAIRAVQADRGAERGFRDDLSGTVVRRLFVRKGRPCSASYLFDASLETACVAAGLVDAARQPTITAHRFRHTVGTQLAESGARLHTIMQVLGHTSPGMSMVYAQISDPQVLADYQSVLTPGTTIAGPAAEALRGGRLGPEAVDWLTTNFLKTELELGHCLRLPAEGPCECDLYLSCAKFVTTPRYADRLRRRHRMQQTLIDDARTRGWEREVQRHQATAARIQALLTELGEPLHENHDFDGQVCL
ncbi:tyrosine-type recombinase/integrase [Sphaerisporangium sp. NPDC051017]|uniref:tyrosine-type recombinase/integrase n=1 Tax=Sphaerisporangium sp. NPDC051017 TaxID=3154636 RepID=UPI00343DE3AB